MLCVGKSSNTHGHHVVLKSSKTTPYVENWEKVNLGTPKIFIEYQNQKMDPDKLRRLKWVLAENCIYTVTNSSKQISPKWKHDCMPRMTAVCLNVPGNGKRHNSDQRLIEPTERKTVVHRRTLNSKSTSKLYQRNKLH
ncbi:hypothetical protein JCM33374_g3720 [Metschnikowia sp. JCM 33374]|nr:hypothetical protein JCM33374_g3720 [Metschnikowia sp. JCM 33374]